MQPSPLSRNLSLKLLFWCTTTLSVNLRSSVTPARMDLVLSQCKMATPSIKPAMPRPTERLDMHRERRKYWPSSPHWRSSTNTLLVNIQTLRVTTSLWRQFYRSPNLQPQDVYKVWCSVFKDTTSLSHTGRAKTVSYTHLTLPTRRTV